DRATRPDRLRRLLSGDLDNIVLMAMRKEPPRRYASALQLTEDIDRYLKREPVVAHKDSAGYRTLRFVQRHRAGTAAAFLIALTLFGGIVATLRQARIARVERARAERRFND